MNNYQKIFQKGMHSIRLYMYCKKKRNTFIKKAYPLGIQLTLAYFDKSSEIPQRHYSECFYSMRYDSDEYADVGDWLFDCLFVW